MTQGAGSRTGGLVMAFKLTEMVEQGWRRLNAPDLVPLARTARLFVDGFHTDCHDLRLFAGGLNGW